MKVSISLLIAFGCALLIDTAWADRSDVWLSSSVRVSTVHLSVLPDGGCQVAVTASVFKSDGGMREDSTGWKELSGVNRTSCLDVISRGAVLFKSEHGL